MEPRDDPFQPKHVDEQIEWLAQRVQEGTQERNQSARLVQRLQRYYVRKRQKDTLQHAWEHIAQRYEDSVRASSGEERVQDEQRKLERPGHYRMQQKTGEMIPARRSFPRWGVIVAVIVIALLLGSTAVIMSRAAQQKGTPGTGGQPPTICSVTPRTGTSKPAGCVTPTVPPTPAPTPTVPPTPAPSSTVPPTPAPTPTAPPQK
jgi:hypothetical protein